MLNRPCLPPLTTTTAIRKPGELVNAWKVIVSTLVIFIAGIVTGGLLVTLTLRFRPVENPKPVVSAANVQAGNPFLLRNKDLLKRMDRELDLTPEQHTHIESIIAESQKRIRWEMQQVRVEIVRELTPEQRKKFEGFPKGRPGFEKRRNGTNSPFNDPGTNAVATNTPP
jgi:hypothetical protein